MADSPRDELAALVRMVSAHVEWQRELGADGLVRGAVARAVAAPVAAAPAPPTATPVVEPERAPVRIERPEFMRKATRPAPPPPRPAAVEAPVPPPVEPPPPAPPVVEAPPVARPLFAEPAAPSAAPFTAPLLEGPARTRALEVLRDEVAACTRCRLHEKRTQTVFSRGNPFASLMFVGEGPGRDEDLQGQPFVGAAGQLLDKIIAAMGLGESDVYIANVVKCRPPNNRVPQPDEMATCGPYLATQIEAVRPRVLVALGKTAAIDLLGASEPMSRMRGSWHSWRGIPLRVTWHPAYLLRQPDAKKDTWDDMKRVLEHLGLAVPGARRGEPSA